MIIIISALLPIFPSIHLLFCASLGSAIDTASNFLCIWLAQNSFRGYYTKICGICDTKCHQLWVNCAGKANIKFTEVQSHASTINLQVVPDEDHTQTQST